MHAQLATETQIPDMSQLEIEDHLGVPPEGEEIVVSELEKETLQCPHCEELVVPVRRTRAKWIGSFKSGGLGIVGAVFGISVATAAALPVATIGIFAGSGIAKKVFTKSKCPKCEGKLS